MCHGGVLNSLIYVGPLTWSLNSWKNLCPNNSFFLLFMVYNGADDIQSRTVSLRMFLSFHVILVSNHSKPYYLFPGLLFDVLVSILGSEVLDGPMFCQEIAFKFRKCCPYRFLLRLTIYKMSQVLTYKSKGLIKRLWLLLVQHLS